MDVPVHHAARALDVLPRSDLAARAYGLDTVTLGTDDALSAA